MANSYSEEVLRYPTKGIVIEDNIWAFGKPKTKTKINIPVLMPLQEKAETTKETIKKTNSKIKNKEVEKTANYIEIYLPDSVYTYPTELDDLPNESPTIKGASKKNSKRTDENGETIKGLSRIVKKNTAVILIFIDGKADPGNIKCIGKFDDYEEERILNGANTGGITRTTSESATRTATSTGTAKARGSNGRRQSDR